MCKWQKGKNTVNRTICRTQEHQKCFITKLGGYSWVELEELQNLKILMIKRRTTFIYAVYRKRKPITVTENSVVTEHSVCAFNY